MRLTVDNCTVAPPEPKRVINYVTDAHLSNKALISIMETGSSGVRLVVGAQAFNHRASHFTRSALSELIDILTEIKEAM